MVDLQLLKARRAELHESIVARRRQLREQTKQLKSAAGLERDLHAGIRQQLEEVKRARARFFRH
jgi:hypothetical protein